MDPTPTPTSPLTGADLQRVRAALGLMRHEMAAVLCVHLVTLSRWEARDHQALPIEGYPRVVLTVLKDRVRRERRAGEAREVGRAITQALLRDGRLDALLELIRFAAARTIRWPSLEPDP
jgi:hypothetical protein